MAVELAGWNFGTLALLNVSLLFITSARAALLGEVSVVITPVISALCGHDVHRAVWFACVLALAGLVLLSSSSSSSGHRGGRAEDDDDDGDGTESSSSSDPTARIGNFGVGDILCLASACLWSLYMVRLSACGGSYDAVKLQSQKTVLLAVLYTSWFLLSSLRHGDGAGGLWPGYENPLAWVLLAYSAAGPGTVADIVQQRGQAVVSASECSVILAATPLFTAVMGWLLLRECMSTNEMIGGALIIAAAIVSTK